MTPVEIRDGAIPEALRDAMLRQARAEREKQAGVILGSAEAVIAGSFVEAAEIYASYLATLQQRAMNIIYETTKESGFVSPGKRFETQCPHGGIQGCIGIFRCYPQRAFLRHLHHWCSPSGAGIT